jgi:uroporphyrinogen decarboxylase
MASGTPGQIRAEVRKRIAILGPGGGYIACPAYDVDYGVPWGNLEAFASAVEEYGAYD